MAKSVIDIEVKDEAFKRFHELFQKYQEQVKSIPEAWDKVTESTQGTVEAYAAITAALMAHQEMLHKQGQEGDKNQKNQQKQLTLWQKTRVQIQGAWQDTVKLGKQVQSITSDLVKWAELGGIVTGLAGGLGLWGLGDLARGVTSTYKAAGGLGVTTGELQAAQINFEPLLDVRGLLSNIANAKSDLSKRWAFGAMGITDYMSRDPAQLMTEMNVRAKRLFEARGQTEQGARASGLLEFYTMDELRQLHSMKMRDLEDANKKFQADAKTLALADQVNTAWRGLSVQLERAKLTVENAFVKALTPLVQSGALQRFSEELDTWIQEAAKSKEVQHFFQYVGQELNKFADFLVSPKFESDVRLFMDSVGMLAQKIVDGLRLLHLIPDANAGGSAANWAGYVDPTQGHPDVKDLWGGGKTSAFYNSPWAQKDPFLGGSSTGRQNQAFAVGSMRYLMKKYGMTEQMAAAITSNMFHESSGNPFAEVLDTDKHLHFGLFQWDETNRIPASVLAHWKDLQRQGKRDQAYNEEIDFMLGDLKGRYGKVYRAMMGSGSAHEAANYMGHGYEGAGIMAHRGRDADVLITIFNQVGAGVHVQARNATASG